MARPGGTIVPSESAHDIEAAVAGTIEPGARIMSDTQHAFGRAFAAIAGEHLTAYHSEREYARDDVYASTADGFGSLLERAKFGCGTGSASSMFSATSMRSPFVDQTGSARR